MMSCACGRSPSGTSAEQIGSASQPQTMNGVSDDVAHVSMMSGSPMNPPGMPR
jgi:hypothetical protein